MALLKAVGNHIATAFSAGGKVLLNHSPPRKYIGRRVNMQAAPPFSALFDRLATSMPKAIKQTAHKIRTPVAAEALTGSTGNPIARPPNTITTTACIVLITACVNPAPTTNAPNGTGAQARR